MVSASEVRLGSSRAGGGYRLTNGTAERRPDRPKANRLTGDDSGISNLSALPLDDESPAKCGAFSEAAEGTRTLDLLHGKQTL
jgi:hypothetical protein